MINFEFSQNLQNLQNLGWGLVETLCLASVSLILGLLIGFGLTLLQLNLTNPLGRTLFQGSIYVLRGLPETFILFLIYFGGTYLLSTIFKDRMDIQPFVASSIALAIVFGIYACKIFESALQAIIPGEWEAATTLKLPKFQIFYHIILPQVWQYALPGLSNLWLTALKDTALVSLIGGSDLMSRTQIIVRNTQQPFTYYCLLAFIYLCLSRLSEWQVAKLQNVRWVQT